MRKCLTVAVMAAATLFAAGTAAAEESPSATPTTATATELERVSAYTQPSVVYVGITWTGYVYDTFNKLYLNDDQQPFELTFQCTGYVVNPDGYIATAGHCVDPSEVLPAFYQAAAEWALANSYYQSTTLTLEDVLGFGDYVVRNAEGKRKPDLEVTAAWGVSAGGVQTGKALPARVVKWQTFAKGDGAILKVEAENLNALPISDDEIEIGTEIVAVGYPGSVDLVADETFTPSYKEGTISSEKTVSGGLLKVYETSAATSGGMSGGPAVNLDGEVIGFVSFKPADETQSFNFLRPADTVRELLSDAGPTNELSEDGQAYRDGLDAYFAGDKETAVENLQTVVDDQPTNDIAKEYLDKAKDLPDPPKEDEGGGAGLIIAIIIGVLVLAAIAGLVLFLLSRNKKKSAVAPGAPAYGGAPPAAYPPPGYQAPPGAAPSASAGTQSTAVLDRPEPTGPPPTGPAATGAPPPPPPAAPVPPPPPTTAAPAGEQTASGPAVEEDVFCSNCGTRGEPGQKFCKHCGAHL